MTRIILIFIFLRFEKVFPEKTGQQEIFDLSCRSIIDGFVSGLNGCVFAYGQTGSGKTYTLFGNNENKGVIFRSIESIFSRTKEEANADTTIELTMSIIEIYNECAYDLLRDTNQRTM